MADDQGGSGPLDMLDPVLSSWDEAIAAVRTRAKWLLAVIAAVAVFLFGSGPLITRPELSWGENADQLVLAAVFAALGLGILAILAFKVAEVFTPEVSSLATLDADTLTHFEANREEYLGPRATAAPPQQQLRDANQTVLALERGLAALPTDQRDQRAALEGALREARLRQADVATGVEALLELDRFHRVRRHRTLKPAAFLLGFLALLSGVLFQLTLAAVPEEDDGGGDAGGEAVAAGTVARLTLPGGDAGAAAVWEALGLAVCAGGDDGGVVVVVAGGTGTTESPYTVQTVPEAVGPDCPRVRFTVVEPLLVLTPVPEEVTVEWPDEADATATTSGP